MGERDYEDCIKSLKCTIQEQEQKIRELNNTIQNKNCVSLELKPCPFCGGRASLFASRNGGIKVICTKCNASSKCLCDTLTAHGVSGNSTKSVIKAWNNRTGEE